MREGLIGGASHAHVNARPDVVAESYSSYEMRSADCKLFASRKCSRNDGYAGMRAGRTVGVIGFVGMCENAISEGGLDRATYNFGGYNRGDLLSAVGTGKLERPPTGGQSGTGDHGSKRVQNMLFGFFDDVVGQSTGVGAAHVSAELLH